MRQTSSFSLKKETLLKIDKALQKDGAHRNKSHLVECAIEEYLEE